MTMILPENVTSSSSSTAAATAGVITSTTTISDTTTSSSSAANPVPTAIPLLTATSTSSSSQPVPVSPSELSSSPSYTKAFIAQRELKRKMQVNIYCFECEQRSQTLFHFLGLECQHCSSFNTSLI
jgi:hypothetical protein